MKLYLLTIVIFVIPFKNHAQFKKNLKLGASIGKFIYQGDLTPNFIGSLKTAQTGWGIYLQKPYSNSFSYRVNYNNVKLIGNESLYNTPAFRQLRNFKFNATIKEFTLLNVFNVKNSNMQNDEIKFLPYLFHGLGIGFTKIYKDYSGLDPKLFEEGAEILERVAIDNIHKTPNLIINIPLGAGFEYNISNNFSAFAEANYRIIFTDYLDGFSKAANPLKKDYYFSAHLGLIYKFKKNKNIACPTVN